MKKLIVALLLVASFTASYAQKANVSKAKNKALTEENPDFQGARDLIQAALLDETTKNEANTWYVAGLIGYRQNLDFEKKAVLHQATDPNTVGEVVVESYNYLVKADELDQLPNEKGKIKPKYRKDIKKMVKEYYDYNLINYGAYLFDEKKFDKALDVFNIYLGIPSLPMMENGLPIDSTYNMIQYYAAISAINAADGARMEAFGAAGTDSIELSKKADAFQEQAIALLDSLKNYNYETMTAYQLLYEEYVKKNDTINSVEILKKGVERFPNELWFLQNLINYYIYSGQTEIALQYLNEAIERDPSVAQYYFVKGGLLESKGDNDDALAAYNTALAIDSTLASAYDAIGRMYYNTAIKILDEANNLKDTKKIQEVNERANKEFKTAITYYEKAVKFAPEEKSYNVMLRTLYYRLGMDKDYERIDKFIKANFPELG